MAIQSITMPKVSSSKVDVDVTTCPMEEDTFVVVVKVMSGRMRVETFCVSYVV